MQPDSNTPPEPGGKFDALLSASRPSLETGLERRVGMAAVLDAVGLGSDLPTRVSRFEIIRKLGAGAMGRVYEARDPRLDRLVAIKVLRRKAHRARPELRDEGLGPGDSRAMSVFRSDGSIQNEARALARLNHPHVVAVYDVGEEEGQLFVAMEHMGGGSLRSWLEAKEPLDWRTILRPFVDAGRGLAAANDAGIVHRDFKTDNILMTSEGIAKVADFGLARVVVDKGPGAKTPTHVAGTKAFMAPEVLRGEGADARSDQYSFCAALLAEFKFAGCDIPLQVRALITRGLHDDASSRWPSLLPLLDALELTLDAGQRDRHLAKLAERVQRSWIDGVLSASLDGRKLVSLPLESKPRSVNSPWGFDLLERRGAQLSLRSEHLLELLELSNASLLILGSPGSGKTTTVLEFVRAASSVARGDPEAPTPVVLNLASYDGVQALEAWIADELVTKYRMPRKRVEGWIAADELILVLDGLDELTARRRPACIEAINAFHERSSAAVVVSCRTHEYESAGRLLAFGGAVELLPLDDEAAAHWGLTESQVGARDERLRNPLWLSMVDERLGGSGEQAWGEIFDAYVQRALARPPALAKDEAERFLLRLRWLATNMARRGDSDLWLDRIQYDWFPHRWQQVAAMVVGTLLTLVVCVAPSIVASLFCGRSALSGFFLGLGGCVVGLAFNRGLRVQTGERIRWFFATAMRRFPYIVALGALLGLMYALLMTRPLGPIIFLGTTGAGTVGVLLGLDYADQSRGLKPSDGLRVSLRQAVVVTVISATCIAASYAFIIAPTFAYLFPEMLAAYPGVREPVYASWFSGVGDAYPLIDVALMLALTLGTPIGIALGFVYGGAAVLLHACYRLLMVLTTPLPLTLVTWLDDATSRGLMRRVGGGYMFMHSTLLEHLAREG